MMTALDDSIHGQVTSLCEQGDSSVKAGDFHGGLRRYHEAWNLLPEPKEDWEAATWILSAIGDAYFFTRDFENAIAALKNAIHCPNGLGNPFIHLRIGQALLELGDLPKAKDELARAYMGGGKELFAKEDAKYFAFLESVLEFPPGKDSL